jgi:hypothetical protein
MHYLGQSQPFIKWKRSPQRGWVVLAQAASKNGRFTATLNKTELTLAGSGTASLPQNALGTPSPRSSIVVRSPGSTPHQDGRHQVYPEPQVEPLMRMNKDQDQHPRKTSPQHRSPGLRDKKPPHVDPSDK